VSEIRSMEAGPLVDDVVGVLRVQDSAVQLTPQVESEDVAQAGGRLRWRRGW
jgi:hypothetical protein